MNQIYKQSNTSNSMISKMLVSLLIFSFFITSVSAIEASYIYQVNTGEIEVKNPCYLNGAFCSAGATCRITIYDPTNTIIVNNQLMDYHTSYWNYTLPPQNDSYMIGFYKSDMSCTDTGNSGSETFWFEVKTGGNMGLFLIMALASFVLLFTAIVMTNEYLGFATGALFILTGLFSIIYGVGDLANMYTNSIGYVSLGLGLFFLFAAAYSAISDGGFFKPDGHEDSLDSDTWGAP